MTWRSLPTSDWTLKVTRRTLRPDRKATVYAGPWGTKVRAEKPQLVLDIGGLRSLVISAREDLEIARQVRWVLSGG